MSGYSRNGLVGDLAPQARRLEHVRLVDRAEVRRAAHAGELACHAHDALDLVGVILLGVVGHIANTIALAEVDAARELADDEHVDASDDVGLHRRAVDERVEDLHGAQVRIRAESLPQAEKSLLGADPLGIGGVPLGTADGAQEHRVGLLTHRERFLGKRASRGVDGRAAHQSFLVGECVSALRSNGVQDLLRLRGDLGTDAVARQNGDVILRHACSSR